MNRRRRERFVNRRTSPRSTRARSLRAPRSAARISRFDGDLSSSTGVVLVRDATTGIGSVVARSSDLRPTPGAEGRDSFDAGGGDTGFDAADGVAGFAAGVDGLCDADGAR